MKKPTLKRELSLFEVTAAGIAVIIGAGIYVLIGKGAALAGNGIWLSFVLAAVVATFTGLSYAELSSMFPKAGAEYVYTNKAFGKKAFGKWLAFLIGWLVCIGGIIGAATVALGFGGYLSALIGISQVYCSIGLLLVCLGLLFYGVKESIRVVIIGTLIEGGGLIVIIILGIPYLGSVDYFEFKSFSGVLSAAALVFFAYLGFEELARMAEETKKPHKTMPKAILLAIGITTLLYVLVSISAVSILTPEELGASNAPMADVAAKALGPSAYLLLTIIALFATATTVLVMQLATSRLIYGMSGNSIFSQIHSTRRTPWASTILVTLAATMVLFLGTIEFVAYLTDFTLFIAFVIVNCSLIWLRKTQPNLKRPFKVPTLIIPALGAIFSLFMLVNIPQKIFIYGFGIILLGVLFYLLFVRGRD